jgi:hypothetical protein
MAADYIPVPDALAAEWFKTFAYTIAANPGRYALSPPEAATIVDLAEAFDQALAVATDLATRTRVTVRVKNEARFIATQLCRPVAQRIKLNDGISDPDKIAIGVNPVNRARSAIGVPRSSPLLKMIGATPGVHELRFQDSNSPTRRAKPFGAVALQLFVHVGDGQPAEGPAACAYLGTFTSNPVLVSHRHADGGKVATYYGRWVSRRGEEGPFSSSIAMHVAA